MTPCKAEQLFTSTLMDVKGFFFPATAFCPLTSTHMDHHYQQMRHQREHRRQHLRTSDRRAMNGCPPERKPMLAWSFDNDKNQKDQGAVGEYYRGKGVALLRCYGQFQITVRHITVLNALRNDWCLGYSFLIVSNPKDAQSPLLSNNSLLCSVDWLRDVEAGIALGRTYKAIGALIIAHFHEAFNQSRNHHESVRTQKQETQDLTSSHPWHSWLNVQDQSCNMIPESFSWHDDSKRGLAIAHSYSQLAEIISQHYVKHFEVENVSHASTGDQKRRQKHRDRESASALCNWDQLWAQYKSSGKEISDYYKAKSRDILQFYSREDTSVNYADLERDVWMVSSSDGGSDAQWEKPLLEKGKAVLNYYNAVYDPMYSVYALGSLPVHNPDHDFPRWGANHKADQEHGIALGEYWRQYNNVMKAYYETQGPDLATHYETLFRDELFCYDGCH
jgi:hypothetical protein